jgi:predicted metal-dependent hydrolase
MILPVAHELSTVQYGTTQLKYRILRTARRKTVSIAVDPQSNIFVTAPTQATKTRLDEIVRQKGQWISKRIKRQSDLPPPLAKREYVTGETYLYLGRQYRLRVLLGAMTEPVRAFNGTLSITVNSELTPNERAKCVKGSLLTWYEAHARTYLTHRIGVWEKKLGVTAAKLVITEPKKRWGSASANGTVRINWRIIQAPRTLSDYVLLHELTHLVHKNHSRPFGASLGRVMPDYDERKNRLREMGPRLIW